MNQQGDSTEERGADSGGRDDKVHGEGNYEATRNYNADTKEFIKSGKVDEAVRNARPADAREAKEMEKAEKVGASRAKT